MYIQKFYSLFSFLLEELQLTWSFVMLVRHHHWHSTFEFDAWMPFQPWSVSTLAGICQRSCSPDMQRAVSVHWYGGGLGLWLFPCLWKGRWPHTRSAVFAHPMPIVSGPLQRHVRKCEEKPSSSPALVTPSRSNLDLREFFKLTSFN